jgi:peptide/nickel transport system ATP-binding protein
MVTRPSSVLDISGLTVAYRQGEEWLPAVRDFALQIDVGQTYGLVGESGSGKTTVALAVMRYLGKDGRILDGQILFDGRDLLNLFPGEMRDVWGRQIALVPQDPQSSLNPSMRIGEQISEILRRHMGMGRKEAAARSEELLHMVRIPDSDRVAASYPHQISGGMQQRVLIAMALSTEPQLLILDEPTTGLDVTTQAAILDLFRDLIRERQTAVLYVSHNLGVVADICNRVAVLYAGELVEDAAVDDLFKLPLHPYTVGLLDSVPRLGQTKTDVSLHAIPGQIPALSERPASGCVFAPRCAVAIERCVSERPFLEASSSTHAVRCLRWQEMATGQIVARQESAIALSTPPRTGERTVLRLQDLKVYFEVGRSLPDALRGRPPSVVRAVDDVDMTVSGARTLGIVGESGSGKTTLARAVVGLVERTGGEIDLLGLALPPQLSQRSIETLRQVQYVFQNPDEALNPYMTVGQTLSRPFISLLGMSTEEAAGQIPVLLEAVRLPASYAKRLPNQLSGGEKQRVAIARAFAASPDLLLADEPVSALDVSVQASILNLLRDLQYEQDNALVFISHDLAVVGYLADEIAVMYAGQIMELADGARLFQPPLHPYTEALLSAIPVPDPEAANETVALRGEVPSQTEVTTGCPFHTRCPRYVGEICRRDQPPWQGTVGSDRIRCHIPLVDLVALQVSEREEEP